MQPCRVRTILDTRKHSTQQLVVPRSKERKAQRTTRGTTLAKRNEQRTKRGRGESLPQSPPGEDRDDILTTNSNTRDNPQKMAKNLRQFLSLLALTILLYSTTLSNFGLAEIQIFNEPHTTTRIRTTADSRHNSRDVSVTAKESLDAKTHSLDVRIPSKENSLDVRIPSEEDSPEEIIPSEEDSPEESIPSEEDSPEEIIPSEEDSPEEIIPSEEDSPEESIPSEEDSPEEIIPSEEDSPEEIIPIEEDSPEESIPSEKDSSDESIDSEENLPDESIPSEEDSSDASIDSEESLPDESLPSEEDSSDESIDSEESLPDGGEPSKEVPDTRIPQNICFGMAMKLSMASLHVFVKSFREATKDMSNARIVLFVSPELSDEEISFFKEYSVETLPYPVFDDPILIRYGVESTRYFLLKEILEKSNFHDQSRLLFVDVKDSVFQSNPFDIFPSDRRSGLWASLEGTKQIRECGFNHKLISRCYGMDMLSKVQNETISCSGVTLATADEAKVYLKWMTSEMSKRQCYYKGVDQGFHNVMLYATNVTRRYFLNVEDGMIANLHYLPRVDTPLENGLVVSGWHPKRRPFVIVHHYNRRVSLTKFLENKYYVPTAQGQI
jgi:hypothetical protein